METLFVPALEPAVKHATILKTFDDLKHGDSLLIINDHDPIPLYYEMKAVKGEFDWKKIENGPDVWKVEITKNALPTTPMEDFPACSVKSNPIVLSGQEGEVLNVTLLEPKLKHPTIFKKFDSLKEGEKFQILNDHDPKPLYYQMIAERGNCFTWTYVEQGPQWWKVSIRKNEIGTAETVGEIAAKDLRKAEVFKKYGIDFCCGGKRPLKEVCEEKGLSIALLEAELNELEGATVTTLNFADWNPTFLADYIFNQHHKYFYREDPEIKDIMQKVVDHHSNVYPFLTKLRRVYNSLSKELHTHFVKEEQVIFPFIQTLQQVKLTRNKDLLDNIAPLARPLQRMEFDHEEAGETLRTMRKVTNGYVPPQDACNSFNLLYKKLSELEADLHMHIHLENNILFPAAIKLEEEVNQLG